MVSVLFQILLLMSQCLWAPLVSSRGEEGPLVSSGRRRACPWFVPIFFIALREFFELPGKRLFLVLRVANAASLSLPPGLLKTHQAHSKSCPGPSWARLGCPSDSVQPCPECGRSCLGGCPLPAACPTPGHPGEPHPGVGLGPGWDPSLLVWGACIWLS